MANTTFLEEGSAVMLVSVNVKYARKWNYNKRASVRSTKKVALYDDYSSVAGSNCDVSNTKLNMKYEYGTLKSKQWGLLSLYGWFSSSACVPFLQRYVTITFSCCSSTRPYIIQIFSAKIRS